MSHVECHCDDLMFSLSTTASVSGEPTMASRIQVGTFFLKLFLGFLVWQGRQGHFSLQIHSQLKLKHYSPHISIENSSFNFTSNKKASRIIIKMTCHYDSPPQVFVFESGGRTFHWTPHTCPSLIMMFHSLKNTCSLVHCSSVQEATGYWWFNDITSDDRRSRDPVLLCFMSSRQLMLSWAGPTAATSSGQVVFQTLIIWPRHGDGEKSLPAFTSWPGITIITNNDDITCKIGFLWIMHFTINDLELEAWFSQINI